MPTEYVFVVEDPAPPEHQVLNEEKALGVCADHYQDVKMEPPNDFSKMRD